MEDDFDITCVGVQKIHCVFRVNNGLKIAFREVAPFVVCSKAIADDDPFIASIQSRDKVRADKSCATGYNDHVRTQLVNARIKLA